MRDGWFAFGWALRLVVFLSVVYLVFALLAQAIDRLPLEAPDSPVSCPPS